MSPKVTESYKRQRRLDIVMAAQALFAEKGYTSAVMQDVIDATGLSRGAVYSYFQNKEELYQAVIETRDLRLWEALDELRSARPLWPALCRHLTYEEVEDEVERETTQLIGTQFEYVISGRRDEERLAFVRKRFARIQSAYVALINEAVERGELHPRLAVEDAMRFVFSANDGMHLDWLINGGRQSRIVRQREMLVEYLLYALCPE